MKFIETFLKFEITEKYPNARINEGKADRDYLIYTIIMAFDEKESQNVEEFLKEWIPF